MKIQLHMDNGDFAEYKVGSTFALLEEFAELIMGKHGGYLSGFRPAGVIPSETPVALVTVLNGVFW